MIKVIFLVVMTVNLVLTRKQQDDVLQLIDNAGYVGEAHRVTTEDGYVLKVHRIRSNYSTELKQHPVFLMHGLFAASADFLVTGPKIALAYLLADKGYDVFMGNCRGNKHSSKHKILSPDSRKFWNFSFHEIGYFDLPAMIDFMLHETNSLKAFYVGHSQGASALLVFLSARPEYNDKIIQSHLMAPASFIAHSPHPLAVLLATEVKNGILSDYKYLNFARFWDVAIRFSRIFCTESHQATLALCRNIIFGIVGKNKNGFEIDNKVLKTLVTHISPRISVKQISHYLQLLFSGKFQGYDYRFKNKARYNATTPPRYKLENIVTPVYLYQGTDDLIVARIDVEHLKRLLPNLGQYRLISNFNHIDFTYGRNTRKLVYNDIVKAIETVQ